MFDKVTQNLTSVYRKGLVRYRPIDDRACFDLDLYTSPLNSTESMLGLGLGLGLELGLH